MVGANETNMISQSSSNVGTMGGRFHPYLGRRPRGQFSADEVLHQSGSRSYYQPKACASSATYQHQQTIGTAFAIMPTARETHDDLSQYISGNISQLSTLKTLQDVCGLGLATASYANAAWLNGNVLSSTTQGSVKRTFESQNEVEGAIFDHPFYNRRRRAAAPEEGMTRTRDKYRVVYTEKQRNGLGQAYEENKFITMETRTNLSKELDLSDRQIKIWFQNRRAKERRDLKRSSVAESSTSDSDQSNSSDSASVTSSCRFGGNESEIRNEPFQSNSMDFQPDQFSGYHYVPTLFDSQQVTTCRWGNTFEQGPRNLDSSPLGTNTYEDFSTPRL
ncbi:homeobox protein Hox-B13a-like [Dreissena polymorpha]|uniref:homeobox protein Hox-B13a-like n=1 Tax=Dreissena polymorpha TaxID=45954 RepID=UPI002264CC72|nr:homeobox protein Hox-B13a-like [Dreissena polymorpha]